MNSQKEPMAARELISGGSPEQIEARFPKLNDSQIAGLAAFGQQRDAQPHDVILERGDLHHGIFVVLRGRIEVLRVSAEGETVLHTLDRGEFTGDVNLLSGRGTLIRARALEASALLEIDRANLRHIIQWFTCSFFVDILMPRAYFARNSAKRKSVTHTGFHIRGGFYSPTSPGEILFTAHRRGACV